MPAADLDLETLNDLLEAVGGSTSTMRSLVDLYRQQVDDFSTRWPEPDLAGRAHSLAGASATLGLGWLAGELLELESSMVERQRHGGESPAKTTSGPDPTLESIGLSEALGALDSWLSSISGDG